MVATTTANVEIVVNPVNDAPVANDDSGTTEEDSPVTIDVLFNDSDPDDTLMTVSITTEPEHGSVEVNPDGTVTYTPDDDYNGPDSFEYEVCDPSGACDTAVVSIEVTPVNDAPVAEIDMFSTEEDTPLMGTVADNDFDIDGDDLTFSLITPPGTHAFSFNDDGSFTFIPNENFVGAVTFEYEVCDEFGGCDTATATIDVTPVNDGPTAFDDGGTTDEDNAVTINLLGNDTDPEDDTLVVTEINGQPVTPGDQIVLPSGAVVTLNADGTATYDPNGEYDDLLTGQSALDTFVYTISDGNGGTSEAETVVMINGENDLPIAQDDYVSHTS